MTKLKTENIECPVCKGKGKVPTPRKASRAFDVKKNAVLTLVSNGFSYREICTLMGYKSVGSVQRVLRSIGHVE